jgi:hypothetical protein
MACPKLIENYKVDLEKPTAFLHGFHGPQLF